MFERFGKEGGRIHILEQTEMGKWLTNERWALLYPIHLLGTSELLLKPGEYCITKDGNWEYLRSTRLKMTSLLPTLTKESKTTVKLVRKTFYKHPLTVDYRKTASKRVLKCYILDPHNKIIEGEGPGTLVRKVYYDRIQKLYPKSEVYGSIEDPSKPVLFMVTTGIRTRNRSIVGVIASMNYGNTDCYITNKTTTEKSDCGQLKSGYNPPGIMEE
jgi:hypothetical protein